MSREILTKCPNCGLPLHAEHRKGNLMRCPACKTIFEIKLKSSQSLGKCPHGCGETIRIDDYVDDVRLQCVHCHGYSIARTAKDNMPWSPTQEEPPVLYKYLGKCPNCSEPIGDSDRDEAGNLTCPHCNTLLVARSEYHVSEKIGDCPICGEPLGKGDIGVEDKCYCENCKQVVILDHGTRQIPEGNLYVLPDLTADEFKYKCFELLFDNAPADIASQLEIQQVKLSFEPATRNNISTEDDAQTFKFSKYDEASVFDKFGGKVEFPATITTSPIGGARCYLPKYELNYKYRGQERSFLMKHGDKEVEPGNLPESKRLTGNNWITGGELSLILMGIFIGTLIWWWNSSHGFFSGLWHLILAGILFFIIAFIVAGPLLEAINCQMRSRCQNRKVKEFLSYHGLDYSARNK